MEYRGYRAHIEYDEETRVFHGRVLCTRDVIMFEGRSVDELRQSFQSAIDDYLNLCREKQREPDKPFSGRFNVRISPELHRRIHIAAKSSRKSINAWLAETLERALEI